MKRRIMKREIHGRVENSGRFNKRESQLIEKMLGPVAIITAKRKLEKNEGECMRCIKW